MLIYVNLDGKLWKQLHESHVSRQCLSMHCTRPCKRVHLRVNVHADSTTQETRQCVQLQQVTPMIQALYQALQISVSLGSVSEIQSIKELLALPKKAREEAAGEMDDLCDLCVSTEL